MVDVGACTGVAGSHFGNEVADPCDERKKISGGFKSEIHGLLLQAKEKARVTGRPAIFFEQVFPYKTTAKSRSGTGRGRVEGGGDGSIFAIQEEDEIVVEITICGSVEGAPLRRVVGVLLDSIKDGAVTGETESRGDLNPPLRPGILCPREGKLLTFHDLVVKFGRSNRCGISHLRRARSMNEINKGKAFVAAQAHARDDEGEI